MIHSLLESNYKKIEVIVIDDASPSGIPEEITSLQNVKVIRNQKEKFVSGSRNTGIKSAKGDLYFLIDDDNVVEKETISELINVIHSNSLIGVVCPLNYYLEDPRRIWWAGTIRNKMTSLTRSIGKDQIDVCQFKTLIRSESFRNAFMVRKKVIQDIGLFDEKHFPIHYEEADFSERIKQIGLKIVVVPTAKIWHNIPRLKSPRSLHAHTNLRA
ncbi:MAG: glycosyltransferase family 2 protein, partial [Candidatus Hodarchaeota archaeon]